MKIIEMPMGLGRTCLSLALALCALVPLNVRAQAPAASVNVWTWHNDNGRTGQNLGETSLTPTSVNKNGFGQVCSYAVDGQIYAQPLVLANATVNGVNHSSVVYVVTQNDSVYLLDGTNCSRIASARTGTSTSLIPTGETAVDCHDIGGMECGIVAPTVGILGTPVIDENTNHIYLVTYSTLTVCSPTSVTSYYHRIHALFTGLNATTPLAEDTTYNSPQVITSGSFAPAFSSANHIQRPGLLLLPSTASPKPALFIGFSMMDGAAGYPPGFVFRYNADNLSAAPEVYTTEPTTGKEGGGIWMDGAGLAAGIDSTGGNTYLYFATGDGDFDTNTGGSECVDCGDSFVKLTTGLSVSNFFAPYDPVCRFTQTNDPDLDFGSGGVMLIPDNLLSSWPYLAVSADKEGYIWVMQRLTPGSFGGDHSCPAAGTNGNLETVTGTGLYHNTPAFWQTGTRAGNLYYASFNGPLSQYPVQSTCTSGNPPVCNATSTTASDPSGNVLAFSTGTTPTISSNSTSNGILWALDGMSVEGTNNGVLWAFNATTMKHLYNSTQCTGDAIYSATQFSVPTIANGYVYVGAQSNNNTGSLTLGQGTFYIFGLITGKTC